MEQTCVQVVPHLGGVTIQTSSLRSWEAEQNHGKPHWKLSHLHVQDLLLDKMEVWHLSDSFRICSNQNFQSRLFASDLIVIAEVDSYADSDHYTIVYSFILVKFLFITSLTSFCSSSDSGTSVRGFGAIFWSRISWMRYCYFFPILYGDIQLRNVKGDKNSGEDQN